MKDRPTSAQTVCPDCGSTDVEEQGFVRSWIRMFCDQCGRVFYLEDLEE